MATTVAAIFPATSVSTTTSTTTTATAATCGETNDKRGPVPKIIKYVKSDINLHKQECFIEKLYDLHRILQTMHYQEILSQNQLSKRHPRLAHKFAHI